jgi:hypothetical protein
MIAAVNKVNDQRNHRAMESSVTRSSVTQRRAGQVKDQSTSAE